MVVEILGIPEVYGAMRFRLALLLAALAVLLTGCGYWVVEDAPVQVGHAYLEWIGSTALLP